MTRLIVVAALLACAIVAGGESWLEFIDAPSLLITLGGSLGVIFLTYSTERIADLAALVWSLRGDKPRSRGALVEDLKRFARLYRLKGSRGLEGQEEHIADPFLKRGVGMLVDIEGEDDIRDQLESAVLATAARYQAAGQILATLGKLLPTFGLIGTLIGLVLLLRQMSGPDPESLTSSFALAIMTTLYGALLANVAVLPLAAKLQSAEQEKTASMRLVADWALALARGASPAAVERRLNVFPAVAGAGENRSWRSRAHATLSTLSTLPWEK